jgi:hypothetical protein
VDPWIRKNRVLTGADFDPESFCRATDGSFWIGEEFGPFLLHVDSTGRLLTAPFSLPGVMSPQNPYLGKRHANLDRSGGFEGMAMNQERTRLYPMLEKPLKNKPVTLLGIYAFDLETESWIQETPVALYPLDSPEHRIGDICNITGDMFIVIERDRKQGREAEFKRLFRIDFNNRDANGILQKQLILDLLQIPDPHSVAGSNPVFTFPFETIEGIVCIDTRTILFCNDNNYPFSVGRHVNQGAPDDTEFVMIRFRHSLFGNAWRE